MLTDIINHIQKYVKLDDRGIEAMYEYVKPLSLKRGEYLVKEGSVCKAYYFVNKGCLRMFYNNDKGLEQIVQFAIEDWWLTDYFSISTQKASEYNIQAVENSEVISIDYASLIELTNEVPLLERYFRMMAERGYAASQFRLKLIFNLSKEDMYLHFNSLFPTFMQRIPLYMIASYLGITPEYLSEIRRKNAKL
ncbi:Crp/Fnr family transcriptional regulator [Dysgonomonas sp. ZJ279]|uniref:Crp/Fnr family transcriptional regulator n=1 Tax=Dysgonomonas sp. ZJ279 TaxID=2709796 RepID=UPI0013ED9C0F|nr:Crp/Fnr family transcriptional regulator [Dysgonomonas sp. ZJ279]